MIRKEVTIGECRLILGDARKVARLLQADVLVTDPVWPNCPPHLIPGAENPMRLWRAFCKVLPSVERAVVVMRHDSDPRFLAPLSMPYARAVILPYVMPGYIGRFLGGDEIAYCFGSPIPSREGQRVIPGRAPSVQPDGRAANGHPCSRALEHFNFLIRWWSEPGEIVLDPFMGSGTTGVACAKRGRRFIGIEIEERYFDIACERISKAYAQPDMFVPRAPEPVQQPLFGDGRAA
jgi:site-specific DNA-methyltransferase (adenine-specific)